MHPYEFHPYLLITCIIFMIMYIGYIIGFKLYLKKINDKIGKHFKPGYFLLVLLSICFILVILSPTNYLAYNVHLSTIFKEARNNLQSIYAAQMSYFSEHNTYAGGTSAFDLLEWDITSGFTYVAQKINLNNNSTYAVETSGIKLTEFMPKSVYDFYCGEDIKPGTLNTFYDPDEKLSFSLKAKSSDKGFICLAVKPFDSDVWMINEKKRLLHLRNGYTNITILDLNDPDPSLKFAEIKQFLNDWNNIDGYTILLESLIILMVVVGMSLDFMRYRNALDLVEKKSKGRPSDGS